MFALVFTTALAYADYYPGTNIEMKAGDILYSSKKGSSLIVGHVAIVADDNKIYHANSIVDDGQTSAGGKSDTVSNYRTRHKSGEDIEIYRFNRSTKAAAGRWVKEKYSKVTDYEIPAPHETDRLKLNVLNPSYCSKFIWQALYYGLEYPHEDITSYRAKVTDSVYILPSEFTSSPFEKVGSFKA
ncbi:hypothetical protein [Paenibacillus popilliae]|uniref:Uncharacterized protein n=1 Tax=Paenibacillus popilliae ATCC 14706 TaxID=1212764 RepID=M9LIF7_PAEPP|nr:hypothetical protein [Paenibacillus popilliae]GAC42860.1 hypothetical protein PPOP_2220 [Paenibacillus popilliae ATCC 14706]